MKHYTIDVTFEIQAPLVVKATSTWKYGVDVMFNRDLCNRLCIPSTHIKGKLREAIKELSLASNGSFQFDINKYLGNPSGDEKDGDYSPYKGLLKISDFVFDSSAYENNNFIRVSIENELGTTKEGALLNIELPLRHGKRVEFKGKIEFYEEDDSKAQEIFKNLTLALRWIATIGAFNTVGFGSVKSVKTELSKKPVPTFSISNNKAPSVDKNTQVLELEIKPKEPILVGGPRNKSNYIESLDFITGSAIKGSLATCINRVLNIDLNTPIGDKGDLKNLGLELISKNYDNIRFTHAFPTIDNTRPFQIPLSIINTSHGFRDAFLLNDDEFNNFQFIEFKIDWKDDSDIKSKFHWATPNKIFHTRTAIDEQLRSAKHEKLFTYQFLLPVDYYDREIVWKAKVYIPENPSGNKEELICQLIFAIENYLTHIGKLDGEISVRCYPSQPDEIPDDNILIVTLQSDAFMVDPEKMRKKENKYNGDKLKEFYESYWNDASEGSWEMIDFYAEQDIHGGYPVRRYQGKKQYYPFYVTKAGSTFKLQKVINSSKANNKIKEFICQGLPTLPWAITEYADNNEPLWKTCPFIRENGYGEVKITKPEWYLKEILERM